MLLFYCGHGGGGHWWWGEGAGLKVKKSKGRKAKGMRTLSLPGPFRFTSTEVRWLIRDGDRVGGTGFQAKSKAREILEEGGGAGPSTLPRRDNEWGGGAGLSKLDVFCFELSKLFVNSGATDIVLVTLSSTAVERAITQCTSRWAMARGHRLNTSIVLAAVHGLSGLFRAVSAVEPFTLSSPSHSVPVPNRPSRLRGR